MQVRVEPREEWQQIFREAWRIERDFFWDPEMGGLDWQAIGKRELLALISPREGADIPWPPNAVFGPKVMLINEQAGSGGDAFPWFFKHLNIGPLVGTRTWGGLVGVSRRIPLMDGGGVTAPEVGFWTTDNGGEWVAENYGVDPDYEVQQSPELVVKGHDPQLEKAIELALEALESYTPPGERPAYPRH